METRGARGGHCAGASSRSRRRPARALTLEQVGTYDFPVYVTSPPDDPSRLFVVERGGLIRQTLRGVNLDLPRPQARSSRRRAWRTTGCTRWPSRPISRPPAASTSATPARGGRPARRRVHRERRQRQPGDAAAGTGVRPQRHTSLRRTTRVRARRLPLRLHGRQRPRAVGAWGRPRRATARAWRPCTERCSGSIRGSRGRSPTRSRPTTRSSGWPGSTRSGATGCATPGASRSTGRPGTWRSRTSARTPGRRSTSRRARRGEGAGDNYGWNCREGPDPYSGCTSGPFTEPVFAYPASGTGGCTGSIIGGYVIRDPGLPSLLGRYAFADFCHNQIRSRAAGAAERDRRPPRWHGATRPSRSARTHVAGST